jgi:predicted flap endonuclease-1-like 5' DNA nuclease
MRAIEGNWTPRRTAPKRIVRAVEAPEGANQAVAASARAVTAARRTAEAVVAEVAEVKVEAGRPAGLDGPRDGRKDDLSHIIGVLPVIETALNKLGIYHFDQISELTDENISWIEGHLGVPGRIGRELWREQARELSAVLRPKRAAEK